MLINFKLRPSNAAQWVACPASAALQAKYPRAEESREAADEGIKKHALVHQELLYLAKEKPYFPPNPPGLEDVIFCVDYVRNLVLLKPTRIGIEQKLNCGSIYREMSGTCDFWCVIEGVLHVVDFKFGKTPVMAKNNVQLMIYANALLHIAVGVRDIILHIVQPNAIDGEMVKTWELTTDADADLFKEEMLKIKNSASDAMGDNPTARVGSQCRYCSGRAYCPALQKAAMECAEDLELNALPEEPNEQQINNELLYLEKVKQILTDRQTSLEALAIAKIKAGGQLSDFTLMPHYSHAQWNCSVEEVIDLGKLYGINLQKPAEVLTPTQAKKYKEIKEIVETLSEKKQLGLKLIKETKTKEVFKNDIK